MESLRLAVVPLGITCLRPGFIVEVVVDDDDGKFVSCSFDAISLDAHEQGDDLIDRRLHVGCARRYGAHSNVCNSACEPLNFPTLYRPRAKLSKSTFNFQEFNG